MLRQEELRATPQGRSGQAGLVGFQDGDCPAPVAATCACQQRPSQSTFCSLYRLCSRSSPPYQPTTVTSQQDRKGQRFQTSWGKFTVQQHQSPMKPCSLTHHPKGAWYSHGEASTPEHTLPSPKTRTGIRKTDVATQGNRYVGTLLRQVITARTVFSQRQRGVSSPVAGHPTAARPETQV